MLLPPMRLPLPLPPPLPPPPLPLPPLFGTPGSLPRVPGSIGK